MVDYHSMNSTTQHKLYKQSTLGLFKADNPIGHLQIAEQFSILNDKSKNLAQKNMGKFYTPREIATPLIEQVLEIFKVKAFQRPIDIIDPFCGDGRLLCWLLSKMDPVQTEINVHLWDYDSEALNEAIDQIKRLSVNLKNKINIFPKKTDTFSEFFNGNEEAFDLVLTNPPWEVIKPDPKEITSINCEETKQSYIAELKDFSNRLLRDFSLSRPNKSYGGWGVNLARVGMELSIRLARQGGVVAMVTPSTIFADQNSSNLRKWMFNHNLLRNINIYPAELKLFTNVDQPSVSFLLERKAPWNKPLVIRNHQNLRAPKHILINDLKSVLESTDYTLPVSFITDESHLTLLSSMSALPRLSDLEMEEKLWIGRELDESNHKTWLSLNGKHRFIKGRNIDRFDPVKGSTSFVNETILNRKIPASVNYNRIIWRDVSRPTQKRRVIATIIPSGYVTGNSLGVLYSHKIQDQKMLMMLLGLLSSFMFEFQLRAYLATAHVSAGILRKIRIPNWDKNFIAKISELVDQRLKGDQRSEIDLEVVIAKAYGFDRKQFSEILSIFPKINSEEKEALLTHNLWENDR